MNGWSALATALILVSVAPPAFAQGRGASPVGVDEVRSQVTRHTVPVIGRLVARRYGVVAARTHGAVGKMFVDVGDRVEKNQALASLVMDRVGPELRLREAEVAEAEATVASKEAQLALLRQELGRLEGLRRSAAFSQARFQDKRQQVVQAQSEIVEAEAKVSRALANLELAQRAHRDATIRAPYGGVVTQRHTEMGSYLGAGQPVVSLIDDRSLEIAADVPAERLGGLTPGAVVAFDLVGVGALAATVRALVPEENALTRTRWVRFTPRLGGVANLAVNQSLTLHIPAGSAREVVSVHKDAVLNRKGKSLVFVVEGDAAQIRPVRLGAPVGGRFEVLEGLVPGDIVVVRGNERLRPGQLVRFERKS